jgi:hypothetical protein
VREPVRAKRQALKSVLDIGSQKNFQPSGDEPISDGGNAAVGKRVRENKIRGD